MYSNSKKSDSVYHNECSCLFAQNVEDEKCLKRFYHLYNYEKNCFVKLFICNETIRLKLNGLRDGRCNTYLSRYDVDKVLISIFKDYVPIHNFNWSVEGNDLLDRNISITICDRPYVITSLKLTEAIELYLDNGSRELFSDITNVILEYMKNLTYKKYKTKYESIRKKLKKIKHSYGTERDIFMNEVFIEILQTQCKLKSNNQKLINN